MTWQLNPVLGSITSTGLYTAPNVVTAQTVVVTATSAAGPAATANITINPLSAPPAPTGWYSTGGVWSYRKKITIDHTKVSGNLSNFPVLVSVSDPDLVAGGAGKVINADGRELLFAAYDGVAKLAHEIEVFNSSAGSLTAWVKIPSFSATSDTVIYLYFGSSAANQQNPNGVWDSNYRGVWHLPNGTSLSATDSTANVNNGNATQASAAAGKVDGSASFNGSSNRIDAGNGSTLGITGPITMSAWVKATAFPPYGGVSTIVDKGFDGTREAYYLRLRQDASGVGLDAGSFDAPSWSDFSAVWPVVNWNVGEWRHVTGVYDSLGFWRVYFDGVEKAARAQANGAFSSTKNVFIGAADISGSVSRFFSGAIDEVRISNIARGADWIATEYNNQSDPAAFLTLGITDVLTVATPTFTPAAGPYPPGESVTIATTTLGAAIRYTTDGTTPTSTVGTVYSTPVAVSSSQTVKAIAYLSGWTNSAVNSAAYTITGTVATPASTPAPGVYSQPLSLSTTTSGASIRYTTDGITTPTSSTGTLYAGPITLNATTTIKAIAYLNGWTDSAVFTGTFTISTGGGPAWYNTAWTKRRRITIDPAKVSSAASLTNFPVLISLTADANLNSTARADGFDILFTGPNGTTKLEYERESYSAGTLVAWVKVPSMVDNVIYLYYGNASAADQQNKTAVWDSNYAGVYHLKETTVTAGSVLSDSTANSRNLTVTNGGAGSWSSVGAKSAPEWLPPGEINTWASMPLRL